MKRPAPEAPVSPTYSLGTVDITAADIAAVTAVLQSGRISPGRVTAEFEAAYARAHGHEHGAFVNSGQTALELALRAQIELRKPMATFAVLIPATTYISTFSAVINAGLRPVLRDIGPDFQIADEPAPDEEPWDLFMPVHLYGVSKPYESAAVEDACEASYALRVGRGACAAHSFYPSHIIATGAGGMVTTNSAALIKLVRRLANHGRTDPNAGYVSHALDSQDVSHQFTFDLIGTSSKGSDIIAALGLSQHARGPAAVASRRRNAAHLRDQLVGCPRVTCPPCPPGEEFYFQFPLLAQNKAAKKRLVKYLNAAGVQTRDAMPLVTQPVVASYFGRNFDPRRWPQAFDYAQRAFHVGIHQDLTQGDVDRLARLLWEAPK